MKLDSDNISNTHIFACPRALDMVRLIADYCICLDSQSMNMCQKYYCYMRKYR